MLKTIFKIFVILFIMFHVSNKSSSQEKLSILSRSYPSSELQKMLISQKDFRPFPQWQDREQWMALSDHIKQQLIERGEKALNYKWPALPASLFLDFARTGNRENFQNAFGARRHALRNLVLAECAEGKNRFINDILNGVWAICEESYWGLPAHLSLQAQGFGLPDVTEPTVDLFASETGSLLAWTSYLLGSELDKISPLIDQRIQLELERRILKPCLERNDFWWMGFRQGVLVNNWNPWINSNWLTVVLLKEKDEEKRLQAIEKIMKSLDVFVDSYPPDGGCDEGPGYWNRAGASLFDCLEMLYRATVGEINVYNESLIQEIGRYIYRAHIANQYFINFADASPRVTLESDLVYRYGTRIGDENLAGFGAYFAALQQEQGRTFWGSIGRQLPAIFNFAELTTAEQGQPLLRDVWMEGNQVMAARSQQGSVEGLYLAAQGGHNAESHNHNDVGNFIVYLDGLPMIIDVGVETYTRKTFSAQRYEIWTMQSAYHNLPTINGIMQQEGREYAARDVHYTMDDDFAQLQLDITEAYPPEANIEKWTRTIRLNRGSEILITDEFDLRKKTKDIDLTLMTGCKITLNEPGKITLQYINKSPAEPKVSLNVFFDADKLTPKFETMPINDKRLKNVWGDKITRILLQANSAANRDSWILRFSR